MNSNDALAGKGLEKNGLSPFVLRRYQYALKGFADINYHAKKHLLELKLMNFKGKTTDYFSFKLNADLTINLFEAIEAIIIAYWVQELRKESMGGLAH
ncbi:MAG: hypothetical protein ABSF36_06985 [Candidatus Methanomethylicaceae archaeon]|jgi:hypothetical protein